MEGRRTSSRRQAVKTENESKDAGPSNADATDQKTKFKPTNFARPAPSSTPPPPLDTNTIAAATAAQTFTGKTPRPTRSQKQQQQQQQQQQEEPDAHVTFGGGLAPKPLSSRSTRGGGGGGGSATTKAEGTTTSTKHTGGPSTLSGKRLHKAGEQQDKKNSKQVQPKEDIDMIILRDNVNAMMDSDYDRDYGSEENAMSDGDDGVGIDPQDPAFLDHTKYYPVQLPWRPEDIVSSMTRGNTAAHAAAAQGKGKKGRRGVAVMDEEEEDDDDDDGDDDVRGSGPSSSKKVQAKSKIPLRHDGLDFLRDPTILGQDELVMWQLPPVLPIPVGAKAVGGKSTKDDKEGEDDDNDNAGGKGDGKKKSSNASSTNGIKQQQIIDAKPATFKQIPSGKIGKVKVYESGKVKMHIGDVVFDITPGIPRTCRQEVVGISEAKKKMVVLGHVVHSVVCVPDLDVLLQDQGGGAVEKTINTFHSNGGNGGEGTAAEEGGGGRRRGGRGGRRTGGGGATTAGTKGKVVGGVIEDSDDDIMVV